MGPGGLKMTILTKWQKVIKNEDIACLLDHWNQGYSKFLWIQVSHYYWSLLLVKLLLNSTGDYPITLLTQCYGPVRLSHGRSPMCTVSFMVGELVDCLLPPVFRLSFTPYIPGPQLESSKPQHTGIVWQAVGSVSVPTYKYEGNEIIINHNKLI